MIEIMPIWDYSKNTPLYVQLYEYIKKEIQIGTIKPETKLPSKRKLASYLGISQNTIQTAYDQLCAEGYFERHIHKMRTLYRKKHAILFSAIDKYMKEKVEIIGEKSGLHILLKVKNGMTKEELIKSAHKMKIYKHLKTLLSYFLFNV